MWLPEIFIKKMARDQKKKTLSSENLMEVDPTISHPVKMIMYSIPQLQWKSDNPVF